MTAENEFVTIFDANLEFDEKEAQEINRDNDALMDIIDDQKIRLLLKENRLALLKGKSRLLPASSAGDPELSYFDIPLMCVAHAHPECRFDWVRLIVDLSETGRGVIRDMAPREVKGDPVELETKVGGGLKFEISGVGAEASVERTHKRTLYYPKIVSSGVNLMEGCWDFHAVGDDHLHVDRELRLLVAALTGEPVKASFRLQAEIRMNGLLGKIPLLANTKVLSGSYLLYP